MKTKHSEHSEKRITFFKLKINSVYDKVIKNKMTKEEESKKLQKIYESTYPLSFKDLPNIHKQYLHGYINGLFSEIIRNKVEIKFVLKEEDHLLKKEEVKTGEWKDAKFSGFYWKDTNIIYL